MPLRAALLRSDGAAVACGRNDSGECDIPALADGLTYTQVFTGLNYTILLKKKKARPRCAATPLTRRGGSYRRWQRA